MFITLISVFITLIDVHDAASFKHC